MNIISRHTDADELLVVEVLRSLCQKYAIPTFTEEVVVEKNTIPHSHPVLTLNTRVTDERLILRTLVHEQFHWYAQQHEQYHDCIAHLKTKYQDDGEHNKSGTYPNSYWEHIIVCFNTRRYLEKVLTADDLIWINEQWLAYPTLEKLVVDRYNEIMDDLKLFDCVYDI